MHTITLTKKLPTTAAATVAAAAVVVATTAYSTRPTLITTSTKSTARITR